QDRWRRTDRTLLMSAGHIICLAFLCAACSELSSVERSDVNRPKPMDAGAEESGRPIFTPPGAFMSSSDDADAGS
ncbi:MAG TPA: hypothetical protein VMF89_21400, partial [Polyangiales bacterium]|nr:hypothetical protein [Polyangiales bacterium]